MSGPRIYDGAEWVANTEDPYAKGSPPPPEGGGDGKIFVAIPTFRGKLDCLVHSHSLEGSFLRRLCALTFLLYCLIFVLSL